jgi:hypothetical protein
MTSHTMFILELVLFDGVAVGLGVWQYWTVRPMKKTKPAPPSPKDAGHPKG